MADVINNEKGFKVLKVAACELTKTGDTAICDACGKVKMEGYYIAVLNQWFCPECYNKWYNHSINYANDRAIEERHYRNFQMWLDV